MAKPVISELQGRLIASPGDSGGHWLKLEVPHAMMLGMFAGLKGVTGIEPSPGRAHISVMGSDEVAELGGPQAIKERGNLFPYKLGPIKNVNPLGWDEMDRVWFVQCHSQALRRLRESYGLSPLYQGHQFHITFAVKPRNRREFTSKASAISREQLLSAAIPGLVGGGVGLATDVARKKEDERLSLRNTLLGALAGAGAGTAYQAATQGDTVPESADAAPEVVADADPQVRELTDDQRKYMGASIAAMKDAYSEVGEDVLPVEEMQDFLSYVDFAQDPQVIDETLQRWQQAKYSGAPKEESLTYALGDGEVTTEMLPWHGEGMMDVSRRIADERLRQRNIIPSPVEQPLAPAAAGTLGAMIETARGLPRKEGLRAAMKALRTGTAGKNLLRGAGGGLTAYGGALAGQRAVDQLHGLADYDEAEGWDVPVPERLSDTGVARVTHQQLSRLFGEEAGATTGMGLWQALARKIKPPVAGAPAAAAPGSAAMTAYLALLAGAGAKDVSKLYGEGEWNPMKSTKYWRGLEQQWGEAAGEPYGQSVARTLLSPSRTMRFVGSGPAQALEALTTTADTTAANTAATTMARLRRQVRQGDTSVDEYQRVLKDLSLGMGSQGKTFAREHAQRLTGGYTPPAAPTGFQRVTDTLKGVGALGSL